MATSCAEVRLVGGQPAAAELQPLLSVNGRLTCLNRMGELRTTTLQPFLPLQVMQTAFTAITASPAHQAFCSPLTFLGQQTKGTHTGCPPRSLWLVVARRATRGRGRSSRRPLPWA